MLALLDLNHPLVNVYPPSATISAHGLRVNRIVCGMRCLDVDKLNSFFKNLIIHELVSLRTWKDLRILVCLLTGHADINRHLHIMDLCQDSVCPLCQEEEDTTVHFIAQCSAVMLLRWNVLGDYLLSSDTLSNIHWILLLKFAKASKGLY